MFEWLNRIMCSPHTLWLYAILGTLIGGAVVFAAQQRMNASTGIDAGRIHQMRFVVTSKDPIPE